MCLGVGGHFASGIEQTDSDAAANENPMHGDEPQCRPPERVLTAPLPRPMEVGKDTEQPGMQCAAARVARSVSGAIQHADSRQGERVKDSSPQAKTLLVELLQW